MIYLIVFFLLLVLAFHYDINGAKFNDYSIYWGVCILLILIAGLRYRVGGDTLVYMNYFESVTPLQKINFKIIKEDDFRPFWVLLCSFSKMISNSFTLFQFLHATIVNVIIFSFIKKYTRYIFSGVLFYYCFYYLYFNMEILRESLAVGVFLLSIDAFLNKNWFKYILYFIIAFQFHISAVVLLLFPLLRIRISLFTLLFVLLGVIAIVVVWKEFFISLILPMVSEERLQWKIILYLRNEYNFNGIVFIMLGKVLLPLTLMIVSEKVLLYKSEFKPLLYLFVILSLISIFVSPFYRFVNYLTPVYYLFIIELIAELYKSHFFKMYRQIIVLIVTLIVILPQGYYYFRSTSDKVPGTRFYNIYTPYITVFTKKIDSQRELLVSKFVKL